MILRMDINQGRFVEAKDILQNCVSMMVHLPE